MPRLRYHARVWTPPTNVRNLVEVRGATTCPQAEEVAAALAGLLPAGDGAAAPDVASLREDGGGDLFVELRRASGEVIGEKRIAATLACGARAETAAVFVAAWEAQLGGDSARPLAVPEPPTRPMVAPTFDPETVVAHPAPARAPWELRPAATLLGAYAANDASMGARLDVTAAPRGSTFRAGAGLLYVGEHAANVASGAVTWRRVAMTLDVRRLLSSPFSPARVEARLGGAFAMVDLRGRGFSTNQGAWVADAGATGGVRVGAQRRGLSPFFDLGAAWWPWTHRGWVVGPGDFTSLPAIEVYAGVGAAFEPPH